MNIQISSFNKSNLPKKNEPKFDQKESTSSAENKTRFCNKRNKCTMDLPINSFFQILLSEFSKVLLSFQLMI